MLDGYGRNVDYLRISVTDRCNFRCSYCIPQDFKEFFDQEEVLTYEEILRVIEVLGKFGISKVRITGGEPLVRKDIVELIRGIRDIDTIREVAMTTNGSLLSSNNIALRLKQAGLDRINISLDTTDPVRFAEITGGGELRTVLDGADSVLKAEFNPVKLNVVLTETLSKQDILYFIEQTYKYSVAIRFIEYMPIGQETGRQKISIDKVKKIIEILGGNLQSKVMIKGNGPARYYHLPEAKGVFGFITPMSDKFCHKCSRIRLTADGKFRACLLTNHEVDIKTALRSGCDDLKIYELFKQALKKKPSQHKLMYKQRKVAVNRPMFRIGG